MRVLANKSLTCFVGVPELPCKLNDGGIVGCGDRGSFWEPIRFGVKEENAHFCWETDLLRSSINFLTLMYKMNGTDSHESSLGTGPYPGALSGMDAPPGPIQPAALGSTRQNGGKRSASRKNRKASRRAERKRKGRKASRKSSRKASRKSSRKASRKGRKASRKSSRKASRKGRKASRKHRKASRNNRRNNMMSRKNNMMSRKNNRKNNM